MISQQLIPAADPDTPNALEPSDWLNSLVSLGVMIVVLFAVRMLMNRKGPPPAHFKHQVTMGALTVAGVFVVLLFFPRKLEVRGEILTLAGVLVSAALALSSTTILGNALAGIQLRAVGAFRGGDWLRVGEHFGRVTERGLFHTEIQNEDRDLTTLPNLFLVSNPYKVVRRDKGTFISCLVSLGYDISHVEAKDCLIKAAENCELEKPFVLIEDLGDYAVTYRVAGLLEDLSRMMGTRSKLRREVLDAVHNAGYEVVSPTVMNTRRLEPGDEIRPARPVFRKAGRTAEAEVPEKEIFDKAEEAESLEKTRDRLVETEKELATLENELKEAESEAKKEEIGNRIRLLERKQNRLKILIKKKEAEGSGTSGESS